MYTLTCMDYIIVRHPLSGKFDQFGCITLLKAFWCGDIING